MFPALIIFKGSVHYLEMAPALIIFKGYVHYLEMFPVLNIFKGSLHYLEMAPALIFSLRPALYTLIPWEGGGKRILTPEYTPVSKGKGR